MYHFPEHFPLPFLKPNPDGGGDIGNWGSHQPTMLTPKWRGHTQRGRMQLLHKTEGPRRTCHPLSSWEWGMREKKNKSSYSGRVHHVGFILISTRICSCWHVVHESLLPFVLQSPFFFVFNVEIDFLCLWDLWITYLFSRDIMVPAWKQRQMQRLAGLLLIFIALSGLLFIYALCLLA